MKLSIIDTEKTVEYNVTWVELNTAVGNMVVQEQHAPIIIELAPHKEVVFELDTGEQQSMSITQAVAHVTRLQVKILIPLVAK